MKRTIKGYGKINIKETPISIFDIYRGGSLDSKENYYIILEHEIREVPLISEIYAVPKEKWNDFISKGKHLDQKEILCINGEKSRPMTFYEENLWNIDALHDEVDLWGNVKFYEFNKGNRYSTTDWFTGGTHVYECKSRTETHVELEAVYYEIDGIHKEKGEKYEIQIDYSRGEYIVLHTYNGEEHRLYA